MFLKHAKNPLNGSLPTAVVPVNHFRSETRAFPNEAGRVSHSVFSTKIGRCSPTGHFRLGQNQSPINPVIEKLGHLDVQINNRKHLFRLSF